MASRVVADVELAAAAEAWSEFYDEIHTYVDDGEQYMTQLDHGHEEYQARIKLMAALRDWLDAR